MDRFDYLLFLKNLPMFLGVPLPIIKRLLKNGKVIDIQPSQHSRSFLHSQSVYFVLKGEVHFSDRRLPEESRTIAEWEKGDVFLLIKKANLSYLRLFQSTLPQKPPYLKFHFILSKK